MIHAKNYETTAKFVKVMPKILWPLFFPDMAYTTLLTLIYLLQVPANCPQ